MTLKQEAYQEIYKLSDEDLRFVIMLMRKIRPEKPSADISETKKAFLASAGQIDIDEDSVADLRKRSML